MKETLQKFFRQYAQGKVGFWLNKSTVRILKDADGPDVWEQAAKADQFFYLGTQFNRADFEARMKYEMGPANPMQIG